MKEKERKKDFMAWFSEHLLLAFSLFGLSYIFSDIFHHVLREILAGTNLIQSIARTAEHLTSWRESLDDYLLFAEIESLFVLAGYLVKQLIGKLAKEKEDLKLFAYSVIHDLRSPSIGLRRLEGLLRKNYYSDLDDDGKGHINQFHQLAERVGLLVEDISYYIQTREMPLNFEKVDIIPILQNLKTEYSHSLKKRGVVWHIPADSLMLSIDKRAFQRILVNLVDNALKYGGAGLKEIITEIEVSDHHFLFSLFNDGAGIPGEVQEKIFQAFARHNARGVDGTGMGLAIIKEIVEKHGGRVWVDSNEKKGGTTFYFSIPRDIHHS